MKHSSRILTLLTLLAFSSVVPSVLGQTQQMQSGGEAQQSGPVDDPIRQLNLTPDQRQQIRSIRENNKEERVRINQQLRDANVALETVLNSESPDEAVVEQRIREVSSAQAAAMRMRILTEIRIRRVLTPEQRTVLRSLQQQAREARRERMQDNVDARQKQREERSRGVQNQRNGLGPLLQRRQNPRRLRL